MEHIGSEDMSFEDVLRARGIFKNKDGREGIINVVTHREYALSGSYIKVSLYSRRDFSSLEVCHARHSRKKQQTG